MKAFFGRLWARLEAFINNGTVQKVGAGLATGLGLLFSYWALPSDDPKSPPPVETTQVSPEPTPPATAPTKEKPEPKSLPAATSVATPNSPPAAPATELKQPEWLSLSFPGSIRLNGIALRYKGYAKSGESSATALMDIDGESVSMIEKRPFNFIGKNGRSCAIEVRNVTKEALELKLICFG
jgi:hypothetical protein